MPDGIAGSPLALGSLRKPCVGRLVGRDDEGRVMVCFTGAPGPVPASTLGSITREEIDQAIERQLAVMLVFLEGRADSPVVLGLADADEPPSEPRSTPVEVEVDGERHVIEAREELVLRCGQASILLRADGTIQIRGRDVTSWARRRLRIRGGSVSIN